MTVTTEQAAWFADAFDRLVGNIDQAILGKRHVIRLIVAAMLSGGAGVYTRLGAVPEIAPIS